MKKNPKNIGKAMSLLLDPRVGRQKKTIFLVATAVYWLIPFDIMPFLPVDDLLFTLLAAWLFSGLAQQDVNQSSDKRKKDEDDDVIEVEGFTVDDN